MANSAAHNKWVKDNPERVRGYYRSYAKRNAARIRTFRKAWNARNRPKFLAYKLVNAYVLNGRITKPDVCSLCGKQCVTHGHHPDYNQRLLVAWVCATCHRKIHNENIDVLHLAIQYARRSA